MTNYKYLFETKQIKDFFSSISWNLTGSVQQKTTLLNTLISENSQFVEHCSSKFTFLITTQIQNMVHFKQLVLSLQLQSYENWELILFREQINFDETQIRDPRIVFSDDEYCIESINKYTNDSYLIFLNTTSILHPQTLGIFHKTLSNHPTINFIYTNEVILNQYNQVEAYCNKPLFCTSTLQRQNFVGDFFVICKKLHSANCDVFKSDDASNWLLSVALHENFTPYHLSIYAHYHQSSPKKFATLYHTPISTDEKISIIIPFKDQVHLTKKCLESLLLQESRNIFDVVLVDNRSENHLTDKKIQEFIQLHRDSFHSIKLISYDFAFNFSALHNWVMQNESLNESILLLNNDVEFIDQNAIRVMFGELLQNPKIGFIGLRLLYPNSQQNQFAGIQVQNALNIEGFLRLSHITHENSYLPLDDHTTTAITFACALTRKSLIKKIGGFDGVNFPNNFSDSYLCLAAFRLGFSCFYFGSLKAIHHESATRILPEDSYELLALNQMFAKELRKLQIHKLQISSTQEGNLSTHYIPLRYRIADQLNEWLKKIMNPIHKLLKQKIK